jgi:AraC-like DNA-binding protein
MGLLASFAELLGTTVVNNRVFIPGQYGKGYTALFEFNQEIAMMINNHVLSQDVLLKVPVRNLPRDMIFFRFQNIISNPNIPLSEKYTRELPSVQISTMGLNSEIFVPSNTHRAHINVIVNVNHLRKLIYSEKGNPVVQNILQNDRQLLFEQIINPSLQKVADEIITERIDESYELFFYRVKAEELICRLLMELDKREGKKFYPLNIQDIQTVYRVRERMLENPAEPLTIEELALLANMSQSKLKRLFKQIFGDSIFSYYQDFRMKEAARLLKEEKLSVSEVGYRLGFSNLSHFTRVFEEHIGMKPKRYSRS